MKFACFSLFLTPIAVFSQTHPVEGKAAFAKRNGIYPAAGEAAPNEAALKESGIQ